MSVQIGQQDQNRISGSECIYGGAVILLPVTTTDPKRINSARQCATRYWLSATGQGAAEQKEHQFDQHHDR